ncbi:GntR family transcriptional regulator, histidine utilization repressor [Paracoccus halophilus]|uniref:GntR family transcriptional regulator, histidine utilization repressor n=1 Tax=Paracoccus halophilus TaxID=376733 RepID=A0A099F8S6_9RHOB|nr:GntR family transcriptional regulator [Paracoccus halophilus]KGJ06633.1 UbiC family transcriptional regulator [Paracoccus halophilus]SFA42562.1 GntR family transcriptional regulator, histidine utilization repressor [Paracoccus halophilus]
MIKIPAQVANTLSAADHSRKRRHMTWQAVQEEALSRIQSKEWPPGELIPTESVLAREFGCARATVNRALQSLADSGVLERRRKVGTRVVAHPNTQALRYLMRREIEAQGKAYGYRLLGYEKGAAPTEVAQAMLLRSDEPLLRLRARFTADGRPYCFEERWINTVSKSGPTSEALEKVSPCEWLLRHIPVNRASMSMGATIAGCAFLAETLELDPAEPVLVVERLDWLDNMPVSLSRRYFPHDHRYSAEL